MIFRKISDLRVTPSSYHRYNESSICFRFKT